MSKNKNTEKYALAALGVLGIAGAMAIGTEFFFELGFVNRKGRCPSPDMDMWNPSAAQSCPPSSVRNMKKRRYKRTDVMDPDFITYNETLKAKIDEGKAWILAQNPERWNITSSDGLSLVAHYIPANEPRALFIMVHGYRSSGLKDFACAAKTLYEKGISMLILDNRASGESAGKYMSYGVLERFDVVRWAKEAQRRLPHLPIILDGVSMGAATVLMAASLPLPENVCGIVADSGYTSPAEIFKSVIRRMYKLPAFPFLPLARMLCKKRIGFDFASASAAESVKNTNVPILFAHGTGDTFVPYDMTKKNFDNTPNGMARLILVDGAEHAQSYFCDYERYNRELEQFVKDCVCRWLHGGNLE